ncbi:MAG: N-acetylneuraminate synthase [Candidatus Cloacimonetes bacterium]|nr:N-acetylneuraminate synthase [Candidatus Cloacimonadota bacterium]
MARVYIIAEAGVNHNGDLETAKKLVDVAVSANANAVKFQTFKAESLATKTAELANYQKENTSEESQFSMLKKLELSEETHKSLLSYCQKKNIDFLSTPFDLDSLKLLLGLGMDTIKIPSGEINNYPLLKSIGLAGKRIILSTGMSTIEEIESALCVLEQFGTPRDEITVLQANTSYPTPLEDTNLLAMLTIAKKCSVSIGYSDHTPGINASLAAVAMGATIIEKHFTLDKSADGPDHKASLNPEELHQLVSGIREIEKCFGSSKKLPTKSELKNKNIARKSIVAKSDIKTGDLFTSENLTTKRPGTGISPMKWESIIGTNAQLDFKRDDLIVIGDIT